MSKKTNFDDYLEEQLRDPGFAARFEQAGEAWDVAVQLAGLREERGLSQKELAKLVGTSQQQISRLESPSYEGHSLSMLRRVAEALGASVRVSLEDSGLGAAQRNRVRVIEITKRVEQKRGGEVYRGLRDTLGQTGFTFEYSATFGQALNATRNDALTDEYAKSRWNSNGGTPTTWSMSRSRCAKRSFRTTA